MQQRIILFIAVCAFFIGESQAQDAGLYSRRYEKLDIDTILASPRLVTNYVDCLLNKKPCPPEGKALKRILPEALRTKCGRCWPSQKEGAIKVITKLYYDYPEHYNALRKRWDPTGEYHRRFEEYLRDQKFNVINSNDEILSSTTTTSTTPSPPPSQAPPATFARPLFQDNNDDRTTQEDNNILIANRFGDEASEFDDPATRAQPPRTPAPTPPPPPPPSRAVAQPTTRRNIVVRQYQTQNPIVNIINKLSQKFTTTADFLAAMLRGGVMVQVGG